MSTSVAYSPSNVIVLFNGIQITTFFEGDDVIVVTQNPEQVTRLVGINGDITFNLSNDATADVVLKLMNWSKQNFIFQLAFDTLKQAKILVPIPFILKDLSGNNIVESDFSVVQAPASPQYGTQASAFEWNIMLGNTRNAFLGTA